ncbi:MAG: ABC transporter permease [Rhodospirillaceae bacterium]|nr:ABC transporter permease [Rhodospirillaceae bacterium]
MKYLRGRIFRLVPVFFVVTFSSFMLMNVLPGDVVDTLLQDDEAQADEIAEIRKELIIELGLDKPVVVRYFIWLGNLLQGDFGVSLVNDFPVWEQIVSRLPVTLELLILSQTLALLIAIPLGVWSAYKVNQGIDRALSMFVFGIVAAPPFVVAILFIFIFAVTLKWLPAAGYIAFIDDPIANLKFFIMPATVVGLLEVPILMRVLRVDMVATLQEDYISLAKAKGMSPAYILFNHAIRPSSFTLITIIGLQLGNLISGVVILETIFALPGIGKLLIDAIDGRDAMVLQGGVAFLALAYVAINLFIDLMYALLDPRVRMDGSK